jgi:Kelch motif protein
MTPFRRVTERRGELAGLALVLCALAAPSAAVADGWSATFPPGSTHILHTEVRLADDRVLVAGGTTGASHSGELYNPLTNAWTDTTSAMAHPRDLHFSALLPDGTVLVAGGAYGGNKNTAELFDPGTGLFTANSPFMTHPRGGAVGTVLADGRVLVAGGSDDSDNLASADLYYPFAVGGQNAQVWQSADAMDHAHRSGPAILLPSGKVLIVGGRDTNGTVLKQAETYDPAANPPTGLWSPAHDMFAVRWGPAAALLPDGRVLVAGGELDGDHKLASAEVYDPATNTWSHTANDMSEPRTQPSATLLRNGKILVAGGDKSNASVASFGATSADLYDPATNSWSPAAAMHEARFGLTASELCDGRVLVSGGQSVESSGGESFPTTDELYSPDLAHPASGNLLVNGDAEGSVAAPGAGGVAAPLGWAVTPNFTGVPYGVDGFPAAPAGGGTRFFAGGPATPSSSACQTVDVSGQGAAIDAGGKVAALSALVGGYTGQADSATVTATFRNAAGAGLGALAVGPVTDADRGGVAALLARSTGAPVPSGTRSIKVVIATSRQGGNATSYDDGYVDNVSLSLSDVGGGGGGGGGGGTGNTTASPAVAGLSINPSSFRAASTGGSIARRKAKPKPTGTTITYTDSQAATATLTVLRPAAGRKVKGKCVARTRANRRKARCTRYVKVGSFTHRDVAAKNKLHFTGRLRGHKLTPGLYRLQVGAKNSARKTSRLLTKPFHIIR